MKICAFVLGILMIASISFATDINGTWSGEIPGQYGSPRPLTFIFKVEGDNLTGLPWVLPDSICLSGMA